MPPCIVTVVSPIRCAEFRTGRGLQTRLEGESLRYTAMVALGLSKVDLDGQLSVLGNLTAAELAQHAAARADSLTMPAR